MNGPVTLLGVAVAASVGFSTMWTAMDLAEPVRPDAIVIRDVRIWADGRTNYDRDTEDGAWIAWSGQIFKPGGELHCRGGGTSQYFDDENPMDKKDVDWLVSAGCSDGLEAGMTWVFTWTPLDSTYAPVRYPATGYGVVARSQGD